MRDVLLDRVLPVGFVVFGVVFGLVALSYGVRNLRARVRTTKVPGVVVELREENKGISTSTTQHGLVYAPVLEFRTRDGRLVRTPSSISSNPPAGRPGQRVRVAYNPRNPAEAYIPGPLLALAVAQLAAVLVGVVFVLVGVNLLT